MEIILTLLLILLTFLIKLIFTRGFAFILFSIPLIYFSYLNGFDPVLSIVFVFIHFVCFFLIFPRLTSFESVKDCYKEMSKINQECVNHLKTIVKIKK